jgi:hypothetical protein
VSSSSGSSSFPQLVDCEDEGTVIFRNVRKQPMTMSHFQDVLKLQTVNYHLISYNLRCAKSQEVLQNILYNSSFYLSLCQFFNLCLVSSFYLFTVRLMTDCCVFQQG